MADLDPIKTLKADSSTFRGRLRGAMRAAGILKQTDLAAKMDLPRQTINKWLNGETKNMTHENLFRLADVLKVNAKWLTLGGDFSPVQPKHLRPDETAVLSVFHQLEKLDVETCDAWLQIGRSYLKHQPQSVASPYHPAPHHKKHKT